MQNTDDMAFDWNDLKAFLAVARGGSTLAASKALSVNQTTVARRIEALESDLKLKLFERGQSGSRLTEAGRDLFAEAEKVERTAGAFEARAEAHGRGLAGAIKVTCVEVLANTFITPALGHFRRQYPEVQVDMMITDVALDIEQGEADVAFRSGQSLPASNLVARKLADHEVALYCSRDYAERMGGAPASLADLKDHDLISLEIGGQLFPGVGWMLDHAGGKAPSHTCNTLSNLSHAVRAGLGVAPLGCILADADPRLVRCSDDIPEARASTWLVTRRDLKDTPRVRAFIDFMVPHLQGELRSREAANRAFQERLAAERAQALETQN